MTPTIGLLATLTLAGCALLTPGTDLADKIEFAGDTSGVDRAGDDAHTDTGTPDGGDDSGDPEPERADPFAARPDTTEGLVNTDASLMRVLENGSLRGACDRYAASPSDRRLELLCGKEMFFYETFGTAGVPRGLVDILLRSFQEEVFGEAFEEYGLVPDPT